MMVSGWGKGLWTDLIVGSRADFQLKTLAEGLELVARLLLALALYCTSSNSTSKMSVAFSGMAPG